MPLPSPASRLNCPRWAYPCDSGPGIWLTISLPTDCGRKLEYWRSLPPRRGLCRWTLPDGLNTEESAQRVTVELTAEQTESLLREVPRAYHTQIDEVLLAALGQTLAGWADIDCVAVDLEGQWARGPGLAMSTCPAPLAG